MKSNSIQRRNLLLTATALTAGFSAKGFAAEGKAPPQFDRQCDVLIVGAGMAGLTAAGVLSKEGLRVIVIDKRSWIGGDAIYSTGVVFGAQTRFHERDGITEGVSVEDYWKRLNQGLFDEPVSKVRDNLPVSPSYSGIAKHDPGVLRACAEKLPAVADFLFENGVTVLPIPKAAPFLLPTPKGSMGELAKHLREAIEEAEGSLLLQTAAEELLQDEAGTVIGVRARTRGNRDVFIGAQSVVLATGGFLNNEDLMRRYKRYWAAAPKGFSFVGGGIPTDHTGDGIELARKIGAALEDMESVPKFYTTPQKGTPAFSWLMLDTDTAYVVDKSGRRFVNEAQARYAGVHWPCCGSALTEASCFSMRRPFQVRTPRAGSLQRSSKTAASGRPTQWRSSANFPAWMPAGSGKPLKRSIAMPPGAPIRGSGAATGASEPSGRPTICRSPTGP